VPPPVAPFEADGDAWESELDAWDRALPIGVAPATTSPTAAGENPFGDTARTSEPDAATPLTLGPTAAIPEPFDDGGTPTSGSYAALITTEDGSRPTPFDRAPGSGARKALPSTEAQLAIPTGAFDEGASSASGSYAALVTDSAATRVPTVFDGEPPTDESVIFPDEALPEMSAAFWETATPGLIAVGPNLEITELVPDADTWKELAALVGDELANERSSDRKVDLALGAARLMEQLGDVGAARAHVETALANDRPDSTAGAVRDGWSAVHRARLCLAERAGSIEDDERAAESLGRLALLPHPDQAAYRALQAEWALSRSARGRGGGATAAFVTAAPEGLPRTLADAELAWRDPAPAAALLAAAGQARGGPLGAALLVLAATRSEVARDFQAATEQRYDAVGLDGRRLLVRMGLVRDLARLPPAEAAAGLRELLPVFAASPLKVALARWGARLEGRGGRLDEAWSFISDPARLGPVTPALSRDRVQARGDAAGPLRAEEVGPLLDGLLETFSHAPARIIAARFACVWASDDEARAAALARIEALRGDGVDVGPLAAVVEELSRRVEAPALRRRALRLWRELDPARWVPASFDLAADADDVEEVWGELAVREGGTPLFLKRAAAAVRATRYADAATILDAGATAWAHTRLGAPLAELAAEWLARSDLPAACARLEALVARDSDAMIRLTLGRSLRRLRDRDRWHAYVRSEASDAESRARRASLMLEGWSWKEAAVGATDEAALDQAFELYPLHPVAVALALVRRPTAASMAERWVAGANGAPGARLTIEAASWLLLAGEGRRALALALGRFSAGAKANEVDASRDPVAALVRRISWVETDLNARAALLEQLGPSETVPAAVEADLERTIPGPADGVETPAVENASERLSALERAARAGRWSELVTRLSETPPHGEAVDPAAFSVAVDIDAARVSPSRAAELLARLPDIAGASSNAALVFQLFGRGVTEAGAALEAAAQIATRLADRSSAALFLVEAGRIALAAPQADPSRVERLLRAAVERDPASAPAATLWRRWLVRVGRIGEAAQASGAEAEALVEPVQRVQALLRAAALVRSDAPVSPGVEPPDGKTKLALAAGFLERAARLAPQNGDVFTRLRDLYEEAGEHAALADLLARRLTVTSNPFETTALHLARAELFAGPLRDSVLAKAALAAILTKEPNHARALARLADIEEEEGNHAAAAELLVQRSTAERSPEKLRELFLRLGRIHVQHLPDSKRAVAAYARVLHLDAKNREALDALSLLYVSLVDTKNASAITERLLTVEDMPAQRVTYHLRLGQLAERAGDQLAAVEHFRRAVDEGPRDIRAVGELVRFLDKIHDTAARRQALDVAAGLMRTAVLASPGQAAEREALATVLRLRGRPAAAAAVADLGLLLAAEGAAGDGAVASAADSRRLTPLLNPALDDRLFPATVLSPVRQLFRLLGPYERAAYRAELGRLGVERGHRVGEGRAPRDIFDRAAAELGVTGGYELYVAPARRATELPPLVAFPGKPPVIVVGASLLRGGPAAIRFMAARTLWLTSSFLDLALAGGDAELGAWLAGVIQQFVPGYQRAEVPPDAAASATARMARLLPKKARPELLPYALEASGELDVASLAEGIREAVDRVGLLASGSLAASLGVIFAVTGEPISAEALRASPEARALLEFALSDEHDDIVQLLG
jgi:tetratricopeptide (TPR) repeat protein